MCFSPTPVLHSVEKEPLPPSLSGMINKYGTKVRLHFKMELEQLWLGTHGEKHLFCCCPIVLILSCHF